MLQAHEFERTPKRVRKPSRGSEYPIEDGIPFPRPKKSRKWTPPPSLSRWAAFEVGQSQRVDTAWEATSAREYGRRTGREYVAERQHVDGEDFYRVWRTK